MDVGELLSYQVRRTGRDGTGEAPTPLTLSCGCRSGCLGAGTGRGGAAWRCGCSPAGCALFKGLAVCAALRLLCSAAAVASERGILGGKRLNCV